MSPLDGLDGDIVDVVAPRTAALSVDTACICQPLHHNCNPNTCDHAADISVASGSYLTRRATENVSRENDPTQIVCNRGELRDAALRGCITCAILFAGIAGSNRGPVVGNNSWPRTMKDEHVNVQIKASGELVCCKISASSQSTRNFKHPINLAFYASDDSDYRTSCQAFTPPSTISESTRSSSSFEQVATWLDECRSHSQCGFPSPTMLPKRVIDVGVHNDPETKQPFLFESHDLVAPYIALSHCWGKVPIVRTTKGTLSRRRQGIDTSLLPPAFQDAILIARRLEVRYLWIDSLCIIQDDELDWQTESAKMSTIYQNSLLTISAGLSGHGGGCFTKTPWLGHRKSVELTPVWVYGYSDPLAERQALFNEPSPMEESANTVHGKSSSMRGASTSMTQSLELRRAEDSNTASESLKHCFALYWPSANEVSFTTTTTKRCRQLRIPGGGTTAFVPLSTTSGIFVRKHQVLKHDQFASDFVISLPPDHIASRAWVFQERLLSTRVLNFTSSEIVWECKAIIDCQCKRVKYDSENANITDDLNYELGPEGRLPKELAAEVSSQTLKLFFENQISNEDMSSEGLVLAWTNVVFHYSALQLSNPNDRLPALSGLAKRFRVKGLLGTYVAGLWTEHLDRMLCWGVPITHVPGNRPAGYIAPTWSWASISDSVYFSNLWEYQKGIYSSFSTIVGSILSVKTIRAGADTTGAVDGGFLFLSGQVIESKLLIRPYERFSSSRGVHTGLPSKSNSNFESESSDSDASADQYLHNRHPYGYRILHEGTGSRQSFIPDSISELDILTKEHTVILLLWTVRDGPWGNNNKIAFSCLVLLRVPDQDEHFEQYTRLGIMHYYELNHEEPAPAEKWFGGASVRSVSLSWRVFYPSYHF